MRSLSVFPALALVLTVALPGYADVAPPAGFVETCTMEKQAHAGEECHPCRAYYGNREHCSESLTAYGFAERCRSRGASTWSEIWCRPASSSAAKVPDGVIQQLSDASAKPSPAPSGSATPKPPADSAAPPAPTASAVPPAASTPSPAAAATPVAPATVRPAPPRKSGACAFGGTEAGSRSLWGVALLAYIGAARRRRTVCRSGVEQSRKVVD